MTLRKAAERRPAVGIEAIHVIERIHFAHHCRNVIVHVGREHTGLEEARLFAAELYRAIFVAHGPLRVRSKRIAPAKVRAHARHHAHAALFGRGRTLAEEVAAVQKLSMAMELHFRGVKRQDASHANVDNVRAAAMPIVGPLLDVHHRRVVLGHVALAYAPNPLLPGLCSWIHESQTSRESGELGRD
jgi:hypothetical protein